MDRLNNKEFIEKDIGLKLTVVMLIALFILAGIDFVVKSSESGVSGAFVVSDNYATANKDSYSEEKSLENLDGSNSVSIEIEVVNS